MPTITISEGHSLTQEEAASRVKASISDVLQANASLVSDFSETWTDPHTMEFTFKVFGMGISGVMHALSDSVKAEINLPLAAMMVKKTIETRLRDEMKKGLT